MHPEFYFCVLQTIDKVGVGTLVSTPTFLFVNKLLLSFGYILYYQFSYDTI